MPFITVDLRQTPLIDAQISLSFTQLSEVLRLVVEQSNSHEQRLQDMQGLLDASKRREEDLEAQLSQLKAATAAAQSQQQVPQRKDDYAMADIRSSLEALQHGEKDSRDQFRVLSRQVEALNSKLAHENQSTSMALSSIQEKWSKLGQAVAKMEADIQLSVAFAALWSLDKDQVAYLAAHGAGEERTSYLMTLPAMRGGSSDLLSIEARGNGVPSEHAFARHVDLLEAVGKVNEDMVALRAQLEFLDRRSRETQSWSDQLRIVDEKLRVLDATKADHVDLSAKADKEATGALGRQLLQLQEELSLLAARLVSGSDDHSGGKRRASASTATALVFDETLKRRVATLEAEAVHLEQKKADRSELKKLFEAVDLLTHKNPLDSLAAEQQQPSSDSLQRHPSRPPSTKGRLRPMSSPSERVAVPLVESSNSPTADIAAHGTGNNSPHSRGTPSRPMFVGGGTISVRDSAGGITSASLTTMGH